MVATLVVPRSWGREVQDQGGHAHDDCCVLPNGLEPGKGLILKQDAALLPYVQEQIKETTKVLTRLCAERMKKDVEILASIKGIGVKTALDFLIEMGGDITLYENDEKLIAAAGLDPSTYQSGKYEGSSKISKRGDRHLRRVIWLMTRGVVFSNVPFGHTSIREREKGSVTRWRFLPRPISSSG
jgi:transposase